MAVKTAREVWRMHSLLGPWHWVAKRKAFRCYARVNQYGLVVMFADYRIDDVVSRHHRLFCQDEGVQLSFSKANKTVLALDAEGLARYVDGDPLPDDDGGVMQTKDAWVYTNGLGVFAVNPASRDYDESELAHMDLIAEGVSVDQLRRKLEAEGWAVRTLTRGFALSTSASTV